MNRIFTKSFIILLVLAAFLAGISAIMLLLTPPEARTGNFWISFWMILFSVLLAFGYAVFHIIAGRDGTAPLPLLLGLGSTAAAYCAFVLANVLLSHYLLNLSRSAYIATHIAGFLLLVGGGGALSILSVSARESDLNASVKRSRLFVQATRIQVLVDELSLSPFLSVAEGAMERLGELNEAIRFSDPMAPEGMEGEISLVHAVNEVEEKTRLFLSAPSEEERLRHIRGLDVLLDKAFNTLKARNEEVREGKK